jgi:hypothetical protein
VFTVAETAPFIRQAAKPWNDEDRGAFVAFIAANPDAGGVIADTGGLRKMRWTRPGVGKRGGVRVIYFYYDDFMPLNLLPSTRRSSGRTEHETKSDARRR